MKTLNVIILASSVTASMGILGCEVFGGRHSKSSMNVAIGEPEYVIVTEAPPARRIVEHRPPPPAREYIWVEGYYSWTGREYAWEPGRWEVPPRPNVVWIEPRYERDQRGYRYTPGHWQPHDREYSQDRQNQERR